MAEGWTPEQVTYRGTPVPPEGKLYLPKGSTRIPRMLVKRKAGREKMLVTGGVRVDEGDYACASGDTIASLGGLDAEIEYRRATFWDVLWYTPWLWLQILITLATFASALITGYATYLKASVDPVNAFTYQTAAVSLLIAFFLAMGKLIVEFRGMK
ncbi:MAG: hypothetical protein H0U55_03885 [Rubrobacteraceae bacterium]|nr:hypothetical protein [Rubrobacteraceae bacterium]